MGERGERECFSPNIHTKNYEIIVVNDGSTDNTASVLNQFRDRIKIIEQENKGLSADRNIAIENSQGRYIAFLDDDDILLPSKLEKTNWVSRKKILKLA